MAGIELHRHHERSFETNRYVYPVLSRRSHGLSIGVNLNPDKICNFDCVYCQVDRTVPGDTEFVDLPGLLSELDAMLTWASSGQIFQHPKFQATPTALQRLNDIAFSGDGEPTTHRNFDEVVAACAERKRHHHLDAVKMVLITNASRFHREHVQRGLEILDQNQGEIWAKLEAGTADYFRRIDRTSVSFELILSNITAAARIRPLVIQSLFLRLAGEPPSSQELEAYCERLLEIRQAGGQLRMVQVYTVARRPAESTVTPLSDAEVDAIVQLVERRVGVPARAYYGVANP